MSSELSLNHPAAEGSGEEKKEVAKLERLRKRPEAAAAAASASSLGKAKMSSEPSLNAAAGESVEKKLSRKEVAKLERLRKRQEAAAAAAAAAENVEAGDQLAVNYGEIDLQSRGRKLVEVKYMTDELKEKAVQIRGYAQTIRTVGKKTTFVVVREGPFTVQCVLNVSEDLVSPQMVKFASSLSRESIVDVEGIVSVPSQPIIGTSQQVEIQVRKLYCLNKAVSILPFNIEDAARSEAEIDKALQAGKPFVHVNPDTCLNHRFLDLRTPANQAIFRVESEVENIFRQFLLSEGFSKIHTPTLTAGSSEGGAAVFRLDYFGRHACLAQSPQLYKQMAISSGFSRVCAVGPIFRAENSSTHRHLCEFIGLDVEMRIEKHYSEINKWRNEEEWISSLGKVIESILNEILLEENRLLLEQFEEIRRQVANLPRQIMEMQESSSNRREEHVDYMWRQEPQFFYSPPPSHQPPEQERDTELEETLIQFMEMSVENQRNTEASINNLEIQMGLLAEQRAYWQNEKLIANNEDGVEGEGEEQSEKIDAGQKENEKEADDEVNPEIPIDHQNTDDCKKADLQESLATWPMDSPFFMEGVRNQGFCERAWIQCVHIMREFT
ncbi:hypothetical protein OROGR_011965 [Orobanche gracilis]